MRSSSAGGEEVKTTGDGLMVVLDSAGAALDCAVGIQQAVARRNRLDGPDLEVRVGAAVGDASSEDDDWYGPPVVEAARLCASAGGGEILVSDVVRLLAGPVEAPGLDGGGAAGAQGAAGARGGLAGRVGGGCVRRAGRCLPKSARCRRTASWAGSPSSSA